MHSISSDAGPGGAPAPRASIVMVAWGKRPMTEMTLGSLERALGPKLGTEFELVLVDNASPDDTLELFAAWEDRATVVRLPANRQFAGGCNAGAQAARGEVLLFLNNDMEFLPGTLEALVDQALEPDVGIVGARLLFPDGTIQHAGVVWRDFMGIGPTPVHLFHFEPGDLAHARATYDLDAVTGACTVMRRALFEEVGGFDEEYVNGLEDIDLCVRVRLAGLRVVYRGDIVLVHHESATRGRSRKGARENLERFRGKWRNLFDEDSELMRELFGGVFTAEDGIPQRLEYAEGAPVTVEGHVAALGGEAAEARGLILALEETGLEPAVRDRLPTWVEARMGEEERALLDRGAVRARSSVGRTLHVPGGPSAPLESSDRSLLRLAVAPRRSAVPAGHVLAATPWLVDELADRGVPAERVHYLPPVVRDVPLGAGGAGTLVLAPGHDVAACAPVLDAVAAAGGPVSVLPNVATPALAAAVAAKVPDAAVLEPVTDERELAQLAGRHDVVVAADRSDRFQRGALVAAAAGTPVVLLEAGPATAVLGDLARVAGADDLAAAVREAHADRAALAAAVREHCSPAVVGPRLRALLAETAPRLSDDELAALA